MEHILLVEDERRVRELIGAMLRRRGYQVLEAQDGPEAVEVVSGGRERVALVITDVIMPRMSGPELVEVLGRLRPGLKALYISGYLEDRLREYGVSPWQANFLPKPFMQDELISKVEEALHPAGTAVS